MSSEAVEYRREGRIVYITLNRPKSLNAVNDQLDEELGAAFSTFDLDEEAWVAILHGAGRCFCAGADIKERLVNMTPVERNRWSSGASTEGYLGRTINWKPVIAAVHSHVLGAGISIALECDLIVASEDAQFGITETKRGVPAGRVWAKAQTFMPSKIATELLITGEAMSAQEMYRLGPR